MAGAYCQTHVPDLAQRPLLMGVNESVGREGRGVEGRWAVVAGQRHPLQEGQGTTPLVPADSGWFQVQVAAAGGMGQAWVKARGKMEEDTTCEDTVVGGTA